MIEQPTTSDAYKLFHNGALAFARAERQGIRVDTDYIREKKQELTKQIREKEGSLKETNFYRHWAHRTKNGKPNIHSNSQLAYYLYKVKGYEPTKTTDTGKGATDEEALKELNVPELNQILEIRKLKKIRDTYLTSFERETVNGYMHPSFALHTVRSYRSSSFSPNFQNIPKRDEEAMQICRRAIFPRPGHQLLEVDYSGLEFNINACYSQDPAMIEYCKDPSSDPHADIAREAYFIEGFDKSIPSHKLLRSAAKNAFVFPELYGDYYKNCAIGLACKWGGLKPGRWKKGQGIEFEDGHLSDHLIKNGIKSLDAYIDHIHKVEENFFKRFSEHKKYMEKTWDDYVKTGEVWLKTGFTCKGVMTKNKVLNYPVQGAAFHCLLWSFNELDRIMREEKWDTKLIGQIHDAIIPDVHPDELDHVAKTIRRVTCQDLPREWPWIVVPLDVDAELCPVDHSWAEKETYEI